MGYYVKNRRLESGSSGVVLPGGPSSYRPDAPRFGLIRYNTDLAAVEFFDGTQFVQIGQAGPVNYTVDNFTGDGSTLTFGPLSSSVSAADQVIVFVGSIYQTPTSAYTVTGAGNDEITFTSAPPFGETISAIIARVI
jgi:hypothetical protein